MENPPVVLRTGNNLRPLVKSSKIKKCPPSKKQSMYSELSITS
jgi:hypothetical protein